MILLISYDLNGPERPRSYSDVRFAIEQNAASSIKPLYSQWLVETSQGPRAWWNVLRPLLDTNDRLLIVQVVDRSYFGYLDRNVNDWLTARVVPAA